MGSDTGSDDGEPGLPTFIPPLPTLGGASREQLLHRAESPPAPADADTTIRSATPAPVPLAPAAAVVDAQPLAPEQPPAPVEQPAATSAPEPEPEFEGTDAEPVDASRPTQPAERLHVLDSLRGVALWGILVINLTFFAGYVEGDYAGVAWGGLSDATRWLLAVAVETKFIALFAMLFGAGYALHRERQLAADAGPGRWIRRQSLLIFLGLLHGVLLFAGDILLTYGVTGLVLMFFRNTAPGRAIRWAVGLSIVPLVAAVLAITASGQAQEDFTASLFAMKPEFSIFGTGAFMDITLMRVPEFVGAIMALPVTIPATLVPMLVGMAAVRAGVIRDPGAHADALGRARRLGFTIGLPMTLLAATMATSAGRGTLHGTGWLMLLMVAGPLLTAAVVATLLQRGWGREPGKVAAAGRLALSNYLGQSVIAGLIFYGYGLGMYGKVPLLGLVVLATAIWAAQVAISGAWIARFRYGPMEYMLRMVTYLRRP